MINEIETPRNTPLKNPPSPGPVPRHRPIVPSRDRKVIHPTFRDEKLDFVENTGFRSGPTSSGKNYQLILWSFLASLTDLLILVSLSSFFVLSFSWLMKTSFGVILNESLAGIVQTPNNLKIFALIFLMSSWLYLTTLRTFMGATIGEWTCGICLGHPAARGSKEYFLKVLLRSTLIVMTGLFPLPLMSFFFGKDLVGEILNLKLMQLK